MAVDPYRDRNSIHGIAHGSLQHGLVQVVVTPLARRTVGVVAGREENPMVTEQVGEPSMIGFGMGVMPGSGVAVGSN